MQDSLLCPAACCADLYSLLSEGRLFDGVIFVCMTEYGQDSLQRAGTVWGMLDAACDQGGKEVKSRAVQA